MPLLDDIASEQFSRWEERGRGWKVWAYPVPPEPAFVPFHGFRLPQPNTEAHDDGRTPGLLATAFDAIERFLNPKLPPPAEEPEPEEPEPTLFRREPLIELQTALPAHLDIDPEEFAIFLEQISSCTEPVSFELLGLSDRIVAQFAAHKRDVPNLTRQLQAHFFDVPFIPAESALSNAWAQTKGHAAILEFGLEREFMFPLTTNCKFDPFIGLIGAMSELQAGELALFQVLFQPVQNDWPTSAWRSVSTPQDKPLFVNRPELTEQAKEKFSSPLYAAVVRIAAKGVELARARLVARELAVALGVFASPKGNTLLPLHNDDYPFEAHEQDVVLRQSRRSGMLINSAELTGLVHFPSPAVRSARLLRQVQRTKAAPAIVTENHPFVLGENRHMGKTLAVSLTNEHRVRHMHIVGATGSGKSNLLFNLICQDIKNGEGVGVLDPHGDLVERILGIIPPERIQDVVLVDPSDEDYSVGFNILSAHSDSEKALLASDLVSVFQRVSTSWGDQMESVLQNAILAFLESRRGGTLVDLEHFLIDPDFRNEFLKTVTDPAVIFYWQKAFPQLAGSKSIGPVLTRLNNFLKNPIRNMVSQRENRLDFGQIIDTGKIFLAKLSHGLMGEKNSFLLGSLLMSKFQQMAMSRQRMDASRRRPFWLYLDEFHNFITPSMAQILVDARKYRLGMILAHHELHQLQADADVESAVMTHPFTRVVFRVSDADSRVLEKGFSHFVARDLQNLSPGEAVCRVERSDFNFNLKVPLSDPIDSEAAAEIRQKVVSASRQRYSTPRAEIEARQTTPAQDATSPPPSTSSPPSHSVFQQVATPAQLSETSQPIPPVTDNFHDDAKRQITEKATAHDYSVTPEQWILQGTGRVDLVLERGGRKIACEICATSTAEQEVGHIVSRLQAGFTDVAVVCRSHLRLSRIQQTISTSLPQDQAGRVGYYHLPAFISQLIEWARQDPAGGEAQRAKLRNRTIKLDDTTLSAEERKRQEKAWLEEIANAMKNPRGPN